MISQYTWPNFHGGTDHEGTKILVEEQGFTSDVKYGKTKIFVRSPQTLFALEQVILVQALPSVLAENIAAWHV